MLKKLHMSLIISILEVYKLLISNQRMYNLYAIFAKYLEICKSFWLSCKSPWIGANQLPKDFGYPEHEERDILYTSYLRSEALHLRVQ